MNKVTVKIFGTDRSSADSLDEHLGKTHAMYGFPITVNVQRGNTTHSNHLSMAEGINLSEQLATARGCLLVDRDDLTRVLDLAAATIELQCGSGARTQPEWPRDRDRNIDTQRVADEVRALLANLTLSRVQS